MNKKLLLAAGAALTATTIYSTSLNAATVTSTASANVLAPLTIADGTDQMNFGNVSGDATNATTVVLTTAGGTSSTDGAIVSGSPTAADFDVTGAGNAAYTITLPGSTVLKGDGPEMTVDTFTSSVASPSSLTGGTGSFTVGATLHINANQAVGVYTGNYDITVDYQ